MSVEFICSCVYLILYYIRPHEWMWIVKDIKAVQLTTFVGLVAIIKRPGFRTSQLLRTPHDYLVLAFYVFIVITSDDWWETLNRLKPVFLFYLVIVFAIKNWDLLERYLTWWVIILLATCALSLLQLVGVDPMGSFYYTNGYMKGRMILNNSVLNNPNALGHSVVSAIPLVYYLWIWKRPIFVRIPSMFMVLLPALTVFNTQSKGSYLAGTFTILVGGLYKRHWVLQLAVLFFVSGAGVYLIKKLPRMDEFDKDEGGIQGRETAFAFGYYLVTEKEPLVGVGYKNYYDVMSHELGFAIATHSSYNEIGSTLGQIGMGFYFGILYLNLRVLFIAKVQSIQQERILRLLVILILSFCVSACVIDWAFNATFFYLAAVSSVFHRLMYRQEEQMHMDAHNNLLNLTDNTTDSGDNSIEPVNYWNKLRWYDYIIVFIIVKGFLKLWEYAIEVDF